MSIVVWKVIRRLPKPLLLAFSSNGCGVVRLAWMYCTTEAQRNHEKKELDPLSR